VLLALKGFAMFSTFTGAAVFEGCFARGCTRRWLLRIMSSARQMCTSLSRASKDEEMRQIMPIDCKVSFNSLAQWRKSSPYVRAGKKRRAMGARSIRSTRRGSRALLISDLRGCPVGARADEWRRRDASAWRGTSTPLRAGVDVLEAGIDAVESKFRGPFPGSG